MSALIGQTAQSDFSQAAATNHTNKRARAAQDGDSHASAASDTSAQLTARQSLQSATTQVQAAHAGAVAARLRDTGSEVRFAAVEVTRSDACK